MKHSSKSNLLGVAWLVAGLSRGLVSGMMRFSPLAVAWWVAEVPRHRCSLTSLLTSALCVGEKKGGEMEMSQ